jgi:hypothetical protein
MHFMMSLGIIKNEETKTFMDARSEFVVHLGVKATCV